jgi:dihydrofolate reductase
MDRAPLVSLIAALADNRVIGRAGRLPWHLPADLRHFKALTLHKPILMGRRTWESLPGLLPDRTHIVVTRDPAYRAPGCVLAASPLAALRAAGAVAEVMVVGGAELYAALLPWAGRMYLTRVHAAVAGDTRFPEWDPADWWETAREDHAADAANPLGYSFVTLERRPGTGQSVPGTAEPGQEI